MFPTDPVVQHTEPPETTFVLYLRDPSRPGAQRASCGPPGRPAASTCSTGVLGPLRCAGGPPATWGEPVGRPRETLGAGHFLCR